MAVQDTEKNIPKGFTAADLGQAMVSSDKRFSLISYLTDPIPVGSLVNYVVFVEDATVANSCDRYEWSVSENTGDGLKQLQSETTDVGLFECRAPTVGQLSVTVNVLNPSGTNI